MKSSSSFLRLFSVQEGRHFRDNYGKSGCNRKIKSSEIAINATSKRMSRQVEIFCCHYAYSIISSVITGSSDNEKY